MNQPSRIRIRPPVSLAALPRLPLRTNWRLPPLKLPHLLVRGLGQRPDQMAERLIAAVQQESQADTRVGHVAEAGQAPGLGRSLRFIRELQPGHQVAADVVVQAQAADLYIRFGSQARTRIALLRWALYALLFALLWGALYGAYFRSTNAFTGLVHEYARKYFSDPVIGTDVMLTGTHIDPQTKALVAGRPWTLWDLYRKDPKLFLTSMAGPPSLLAAFVAGILMLIPTTALRHPCRWLGWPTPDEFQNAAIAHSGWIHRVLSDVLLREFGVSRDAIIELQS